MEVFDGAKADGAYADERCNRAQSVLKKWPRGDVGHGENVLLTQTRWTGILAGVPRISPRSSEVDGIARHKGPIAIQNDRL
ncbi:hypothetical protein D9M69_612820 [compost metagenome]